MKIIIVKPNGKIELKDIEYTLKNFQEIVGGYLEPFYYSYEFDKNNIITLCNDEGKLQGLEESILITNNNNEVVEVIMGNVIICGTIINEEGEKDFSDITKEQIEVIRENLTLAEYNNGLEDRKGFVLKNKHIKE